VVNDEEAIDKCVEELTFDIQEATAASAPKCRPQADPRPPLNASIQVEEPVAEEVASHEGPRAESPGQPPPEVGDLLAERVDERTVCPRK
jgi:hypothetical protein